MRNNNYLKQLIAVTILFLSFQSNAQSGNKNLFTNDLTNANEVLQCQFMEETLLKGDKNNVPMANNINNLNRTLTHVLEIKERLIKLAQSVRSADTVYLGDTLVIGFTPGDELIIDSVWMHPGPIIVLGDGLLKFQNAHATILGNIYTAQNGQVIADSSYLYFPQEYFYQREIFITDNSSMEIHNSTMDFGGLVHNFATVHSGLLLFDNVIKPDFSTTGMYNQSTIIIDSIDVAGEFIISDSVNLEIDRANTILLWHQFGDEAEIDISFPNGDDVEAYNFNKSEIGVSGVEYDIQISNCKEVMWGLMPSNGSEVTITDSDLRTIGFWFEGSDSANVSGLVNNSHYDNFTAPMEDRYFHLNNCDVMTWSVYTFDTVVVDIQGCILGEIGVMGQSVVNAYNSFIDGSGGYIFTTDTTFTVIGFSSLTSSLRSSGNSFLIFAYSTMMNGLVQALENSVLMLIQSSTSEAPTYDPGSVVWMANITSPNSGFVNSVESIFGSAWIDKGAESELMDFGHYTMYYQKADDTTTWYMIGSQNETEVRDEVLVDWNTQDMEPGAYFLKLDLTDNWDNTMTATKTFTLLPEVLDIQYIERVDNEVKNYPNPFTALISFEFLNRNGGVVELRIFDSMGKEVVSITEKTSSSDASRINIDGGRFLPGIYYYRLEQENTTFTGKLIKY